MNLRAISSSTEEASLDEDLLVSESRSMSKGISGPVALRKQTEWETNYDCSPEGDFKESVTPARESRWPSFSVGLFPEKLSEFICTLDLGLQRSLGRVRVKHHFCTWP